MRFYKNIAKQEFTRGAYSLRPVRDEDQYEIMRWRNEQIDVLRQSTLLTKESQEAYFKNVIAPLFHEEQPKQYIFSFFENDRLIGYGGIVHINWQNRSGEISFLTDTLRAHDQKTFVSDWEIYLSMIKAFASEQLHFNYIFTYAYDLRPHLYTALENSGFLQTARYPQHIEIDGRFVDVLIHTCAFTGLYWRPAVPEDVDLYYQWANDEEVRKNSYSTAAIPYENHVKWFKSRVNDASFRFYVFMNDEGKAAGQVRIQKSSGQTVIGISIDGAFRGKGYGSRMLQLACENYRRYVDRDPIVAYIKSWNMASRAIFKKAGFTNETEVMMEGTESVRLIFE